MKQENLFDYAPQPKPAFRSDFTDITSNRHRDNQESAEANKIAALSKTEMRMKIHTYARSKGDYGVTTDEVSAWLGVAPNRISGRLTELKVMRLLVATNRHRETRTGATARVFVASC